MKINFILKVVKNMWVLSLDQQLRCGLPAGLVWIWFQCRESGSIPGQGTKDHTCCGATKPMCPTTEPASHN